MNDIVQKDEEFQRLIIEAYEDIGSQNQELGIQTYLSKPTPEKLQSELEEWIASATPVRDFGDSVR